MWSFRLVKVKPAKGTGFKVSLRHHLEHMAFDRLNLSDCNQNAFDHQRPCSLQVSAV